MSLHMTLKSICNLVSQKAGAVDAKPQRRAAPVSCLSEKIVDRAHWLTGAEV